MRWIDRFDFLEEGNDWYCYDIQEQSKQRVFKFKNASMPEYRGVVGVSRTYRSDKKFWYKFFIKGDRDSYNNNTPIEELPEEFLELILAGNKILEEQQQLRSLLG